MRLAEERKRQKASLVSPQAKKVNDALITKQGEVVKFNPQDNILAMKDFQPLVDTQNKALQNEVRELRKAVQALSQAIPQSTQVVMADVNIDGRKVGEAQVRMSRGK